MLKLRILSFKVVLIVLLAIIGKMSFGQGAMVPFNNYTYHLVDRYTILHGDSLPFYTGIRPFAIDVISPWTERVSSVEEGRVDQSNLLYLQRDNWEFHSNSSQFDQRGIWKYFYRRELAFVHKDEDNFKFILNPVLGLQGGMQPGEDAPFQNTRGFVMRGSIAKKLGFYSYLTENQMRFPTYYRDQIDQNLVIPGYGFHKNFGTNARDFFNARGYITFSPIEQIRVQFGHDKLFIGNGFRSLIWSDHMKENLFLRLHTHVGRMHYTNVFSEMNDVTKVSGDGSGIFKKYSAFHYLGIDLIPGKLNLGFFEHIVFDRLDSNAQSRGYEVNYLNPIIFYRAIEHGLNSSDNALLGMDWKWNVKNHYSFYGQIVLDEFVKKEMFESTGWWGNKWAVQLGAKWIDALKISNLDFQFETNIVRPYTFAYNKKSINVAHYNQAIGHPLGANFKEYIFVTRYQPKRDWNFQLTYMYMNRGLDSSINASTTFGGNILNAYSEQSRPKERGIRIGQGIGENIQILDILLSYHVFHNAFFDIRYVKRIRDTEAPLVNYNDDIFYLGFRLNMDALRFDF